MYRWVQKEQLKYFSTQLILSEVKQFTIFSVFAEGDVCKNSQKSRVSFFSRFFIKIQ